jgi:hypothetical protein
MKPKRKVKRPNKAVRARWQEFARLRDLGLSLPEIGRRMLVHHTTVRYGLIQMGYNEVGGTFEYREGIW